MSRILLAVTTCIALLPLTAHAQPFPMDDDQEQPSAIPGGPPPPTGMYGLGAPPIMSNGYGMPFPYMYNPYVPYGQEDMDSRYSSPYPSQPYGPGSQTIVDGKPGFPQNGSRPPWGSRVTVDGK